MRLIYGVAVVLLAKVALAQGPAPNSPGFGLQNAKFVVKLLSPISTKTGRQGDTFTGSVEEPAQFQGGIMEGRITVLKRPQKGVHKGKAEIRFRFERLTFANQTALLRAELKDVKNSQGVRKVDDEGRVIGMSSQKKRALTTLAMASLGAGIGAAVGGATGAAAGGASGAAVGLLIGLKMTTSGSDIEFRPGSTFTLSVSDLRQ